MAVAFKHRRPVETVNNPRSKEDSCQPSSSQSCVYKVQPGSSRTVQLPTPPDEIAEFTQSVGHYKGEGLGWTGGCSTSGKGYSNGSLTIKKVPLQRIWTRRQGFTINAFFRISEAGRLAQKLVSGTAASHEVALSA